MKDKVLSVGQTAGTAALGAANKRFLTYATFHKVRLHDWRLGILFLALQIAIVLYIVIHPIIIQKRYLLRTVPVGNVALSLKSPQALNVNYTPPSPSNLSYCEGSLNPIINGTLLPCLYWTEELALYPVVEQSAMFITTRVNVSTKVAITNRNVTAASTFDANGTATISPNCLLNSSNCFYTKTQQSALYVAIPELFTIKIAHAWQAILFNEGELASLSNKGVFVYSDGKRVEATGAEVIGVYGKDDIIYLSTFLRAAGISFDTLVDGLVPRYDGVIILIVLSYTNTDGYRTNEYSYTYTATYVTGAQFKVVQEIYGKNYQTILEFNRHGVRLLIVQSGEIGRFDFQTLLLTLVSGLGLLAIATTLVDILGGFCWGKTMVTDEFAEEEEEGEQKEMTRFGVILRFLKWPFIRLKNKDGNFGDMILPWMPPDSTSKGSLNQDEL
eukprot:TRINITY_DN18305_c0_g1_i1.p1 TRINITY_DN18305_c0_g1~~TRINITY_DN18305_c0_g1_i1.p1  ORF type:complete len:443 (-),score=81.61 TRINITY_DN18305_c0_g1_i1:24-1352(-)